jgi:hypothetical protein
MSAADKAKLDGAATIVSAVTGTLPITVATGTSTPLIGINAATTALPGSVQLADAAASAAGTSATLVNTPAFSVPKNGAGMTGAAILPSGTDAQRTAITTPVVGMQRFNTDAGYEEVYTGATLGWRKLDFVPEASTLADITLSGATSLAGTYYCKNFTVSAGSTLTSTSQGVYIKATGSVVINDSSWTLSGVIGAQSQASTQVLGADGNGLGAGLAAVGITGKPYGYLAQLGGSSGSSGTVSFGTTTTNQQGGDAGGYLVILANGPITLNGTVVMNCSGGAGGGSSAGSPLGGGGGGGSGGCIILSSQDTLTTPASVTFNVSGGAGSNGIFNGSNNSAGGGGGSGGWIVLQSPNLVDASTKNLAGGAAGVIATGGVGNLGGGGGGSYASSGGVGGFTLPATAGSAGVYVNGYYPV